MRIVTANGQLGAVTMLSRARGYFAMLCATAAIIAIAGSSRATPVSPLAGERILDDSGGRIGSYLTRYEALRKSGRRVALDGTCASACTLLLGVIPRERICVTPRAVLAFHAAGSEPDRAADQRLRDQISVVALPRQRAPVDHTARRIAFANDLSWWARTGGMFPTSR